MIEVKCKKCNKIKYMYKKNYENYKNNKIHRHFWYIIDNCWICQKCYLKDNSILYRGVNPESEAVKGTVIKCKLCDNTERLYYHRNDIHVPNVRELTDKGWHKFGPRWMCSKCYDKEVRVVPRDDKDYSMQD